jgi:glycine/D-amino acid oxidase-like deaminating enzyme
LLLPSETVYRMNTPTYDLAVVGFGFAGAAVALQAHRRGLHVGVVLDPHGNFPVASQVASGLINPLVLKRRRMVSDAKLAWEHAVDLFAWLEQTTRAQVFEPTPVAEHLATVQDDLDWNLLAERPGFAELLNSTTEANQNNCLKLNRLGFVRTSGRLLPLAYLEAARSVLERSIALGAVQRLAYNNGFWEAFEASGRLVLRTRKLVLCEGPRAPLTETYWGDLDWALVRGEGLDVHIPGLGLNRPIHARHFLLPDRAKGPDHYKVGATYAWDGLEDPQPTQAGREELESWLKSVVLLPYEVVNHWCGVRPARKSREVLVGWHPEHPGLGVLNGLGSRGGLLAPLKAHQLLVAMSAELDR